MCMGCFRPMFSAMSQAGFLGGLTLAHPTGLNEEACVPQVVVGINDSLEKAKQISGRSLCYALLI